MNYLDMANEGLLRVGDRAITSLDEASSSSRLVKQLLASAIHEAIAESGWVSCRKRIQLVRDTEVPLFGYAYQYQLPLDYIRNVEVSCEAFVIEDGLLLTDDEFVNMIYLREPQTFDHLLGQLISLRLALKLAYPKTKSKTLVESIQTEYEKLALPKARGINSLESDEPSGLEQQPWLNARYNSFG